MAGILIDDGLKQAAFQRGSRMDAQFVRHHHRTLLGRPFGKCLNQAQVPRADVVEAHNVRVAIEALLDDAPCRGSVVPTLDHRQRLQIGIFGADHLIEAHAAFHMVAHQHGAGDQRNFALRASQEAPEQARRSASRRDIVDAHIAMALEGRCIGDKGDDWHIRAMQARQCLAHRRRFSCDQRHAAYLIEVQSVENIG